MIVHTDINPLREAFRRDWYQEYRKCPVAYESLFVPWWLVGYKPPWWERFLFWRR